MLLVPDRDQGRFDPVVKRLKPVDARVAGGAKGQQKAGVMEARSAVVDGQLPIRPTALTTTAVAIQHTFPVAGKAAAGVGVPPVTSRAQSGTKQLEAAAGAEEPGLPTRARAARW